MTHRGIAKSTPHVANGVIRIDRLKKSDGQYTSDGILFVPIESVVYIEYGEIE